MHGLARAEITSGAPTPPQAGLGDDCLTLGEDCNILIPSLTLGEDCNMDELAKWCQDASESHNRVIARIHAAAQRGQ